MVILPAIPDRAEGETKKKLDTDGLTRDIQDYEDNGSNQVLLLRLLL